MYIWSMGWAGKTNGAKGYTVWRFMSSNFIAGFPASGRYYSSGLFQLVYRRTIDYEPDRKEIGSKIREILGDTSKRIVIADYGAGSVTIEYYCMLKEKPSKEAMIRLEDFLENGDLSLSL